MLVRIWEKGTFIYCWCECKQVQPLWKIGWRVLRKLKVNLPYYPAIPLLGIYLKDCMSAYNKSTCTLMFIAALFTIAKLWKQPTYPTTDKWIKKMWYLYTMKFYSATKKKEILSFTGKWMELENIILSKVSWAENAKCCMVSHLWYIDPTQLSQYYETLVILRGGHAQRGAKLSV
jgi:hypothetical protein